MNTEEMNKNKALECWENARVTLARIKAEHTQINCDLNNANADVFDLQAAYEKAFACWERAQI